MMAKRGTFEMALSGGTGGEDFYEDRDCMIVGALAVHKSTKPDEDDKFQWHISHRVTGMRIPGVYTRTQKEAIELATYLDGSIDWSAVRRGPKPNNPQGLAAAKTQFYWACRDHPVLKDFGP